MSSSAKPLPQEKPTEAPGAPGREAVYTRRRMVGYWLLGAPTALALVVYGAALRGLPCLPAIDKLANDKVPGDYALAVLAAHAAVTIAFLLFLRRLIELGNRLATPHWWIRDAKDIEEIAAGMDAPPDMMEKTAEAVGAVVKKVGGGK